MFDTEDIKTKEDIFDAARRVFEASVSSTIYTTWFENACEDFDFYEGKQWGFLSDEEQEYMAVRKMAPVTVNMIKPKLDNITGAEIQTRTKFKFAARSLDKIERVRAETLSDIAYYLQDKNDSSYLMSMVAFNARVCGVGWHTFRVNGKYICDESPNPLNMVWDVRDRSFDMSRQSFYAEMCWTPIQEAIADYPEKEEELRAAVNSNSLGFGGKWPGDKSRLLLQQHNGYYAKEMDEVLIVKFYYREPAKFYLTNTKDKEIVRSFSREEVEKLAENKNDIDVYDGYKVREVHFCGTVGLLEQDYPYQINPMRGEFVATPVPYQIGMIDLTPRGLVRQAIDPQRLYNKKQTKLNHLQGARQVIMDKGAVDDPNDVQIEASSPDGVIIKNPGKGLEIVKHEYEIQALTQSLVIHERQIESALGIFNESLGQETNAQSGIAIQRRQIGTNKTHAPFLDRLRAAKKKIGKKMLWLIQRVMTEPMVLYITDNEDAPKLVKLNQEALDADGKPITNTKGEPIEKLDISVGEYDVVIEETPDVASQSEEAREAVLSLMQAGIPPEKWTPTMLEVVGIPLSQRQRFEIERKGLVQEQIAQKQLGGASAPQGPAGAVPGQQPMNGGM